MVCPRFSRIGASGHWALAGLSVSFVCGRFLGVRRHPETDRVQWYFNTDPRLFGGVAATLPRAESPDLTIRFARMVIAGPLKIFFLAGAGGLGGWLLTGSTVMAWRFVALFLLSAATVSFFLATTVPTEFADVFYRQGALLPIDFRGKNSRGRTRYAGIDRIFSIGQTDGADEPGQY